MKTTTRLALTVASLAALTEVNAVITITRQPANQWISLGAHVTNKVTVSSTAPPITYQWWGPAGQLLTGETNRTPVTLSLTLTNIQLSQAGGYYVVLSDTNSSPIQSDTATLTVDPTFIKITSGRLVEDVEPSESATWWDPDADDFLDVYVHNIGPAGPGLLQSFYHNNGDGTFTKDTTNALALARKRGIMAAVGDFDDDGDQDIYVGSNAHPGSSEPRCDLYRNDGNGIFTALAGEPWSRDVDLTLDCTFVDYDRDGFLDLFAVNGHQGLPCLYRQTAAGTFTKLTAAQVGSILVNPPESYNGAWADYDNDGDPDLWFENSLGSGRLHRNDGRGFFSLVTPDSFKLTRPGGLGMWGDYNNDGFLDLFIGGFGDDGSYTNALYRSLEGQDFTNVAVQAGVALKMAAWASSWGDYDNDGWLDLFAVDWYGNTANVLFRNRGDGTFESLNVGSLIRDGRDSRAGVRWVDYDNDGFLDLLMTCGTMNKPRPNHLYQNNNRAIGNSNHWLKIKLVGRASNRSGIGAKLRVKATIGGRELWQMREMTGNGYSQTCPGLVAHFGLGNAAKADLVRIEWPSGIVQTLTNVPAGLTGQPPLTITEHQEYGGEPPHFNGASSSPTGCHLSIGEPLAGFCYCLEASADLVTWTKVVAQTSAGSGHEDIDQEAMNYPARFFRLVVP